MRPLRIPKPAPQEKVRAVAPDWQSPTLDNGLAAPPGDLHVAIVVPDAATAALLRGNVRVVKPPLWKDGHIYLHVIVSDDRHGAAGIDIRLAQAMADLGLLDAADLGIGPPDGITQGYPSGLTPGDI